VRGLPAHHGEVARLCDHWRSSGGACSPWGTLAEFKQGAGEDLERGLPPACWSEPRELSPRAGHRAQVRDVMRDRRTLFFMLLLPIVIIPVITVLATNFIKDSKVGAARARRWTRARSSSAHARHALDGHDNLPAHGTVVRAPRWARWAACPTWPR
jgi:hypothetical protein